MELDFSEFHPLDHPWYSRECAGMPGGRKNHLSLARAYLWEPYLRRKTLCRVGRHGWVEWVKPKTGERGVECFWCYREGNYSHKDILMMDDLPPL